MRIALVPSLYLPSVGGVEEHTRNCARYLRAKGHAVEVWTHGVAGEPLARREVLDGVVVRRFEMPLPASSPAALGRFAWRAPVGFASMAAAARRFAPDVVHVHCFGPNGVYATALAGLIRRPLVVSLHGETLMDDHDIFEHSAVLSASLRRSLASAAAVTGCSRFTLADAQARFGLAPGRGEVVPNAVAPLEAEAVASARPASGFDRYVLALGRLVEKKGFDLLVRAFAAIADDLDGLGLVVAGDGPERTRLVELAASLGIAGRVEFPGRLGRPAVAATMAGAELFVLPSRLEPFGIVALEAWRAGTPLLATLHGGTAEFVRDKVDAVLVDPFDTVALGAAMRDLIADPGLRARLAEAGATRLEEFSWPAVAGRYEAIYERVGATAAARG